MTGSRTITVTLTEQQWADLNLAAYEAANESEAGAAAAVLADAWVDADRAGSGQWVAVPPNTVSTAAAALTQAAKRYRLLARSAEAEADVCDELAGKLLNAAAQWRPSY